MRVLAIDPGEKCGWAHAEIVEGDGSRDLIVTGHGISRAKDFVVKLFRVIGNYDVVVWESYRISPAKLKVHVGSDVPTLQTIGAIRAAGWLHPEVKLVKQTPTDKHTADKWIAARLPNVQRLIDGLPKAHDESHDGDALRHLAFYYMEHCT